MSKLAVGSTLKLAPEAETVNDIYRSSGKLVNFSNGVLLFQSSLLIYRYNTRLEKGILISSQAKFNMQVAKLKLQEQGTESIIDLG